MLADSLLHHQADATLSWIINPLLIFILTYVYWMGKECDPWSRCRIICEIKPKK
jgi:hypothetical protein